MGDVERWKLWLLEGRSQRTLDVYYRMLHAAFNRAVQWGNALTNPFHEAERPFVEQDEGDEHVRFFSPEELNRLHEIAALRTPHVEIPGNSGGESGFRVNRGKSRADMARNGHTAENKDYACMT